MGGGGGAANSYLPPRNSVLVRGEVIVNTERCGANGLCSWKALFVV